MSYFLRKCYIFIIFIFCTFNVNAEEVNTNAVKSEVVAQPGSVAANDDVFSVWSSEAELGFVKTTGNTETESLNFKFAIDNKHKDWEHSLKFETSRNSDATGTTAEKYLLFLKSQYALSKLSYLFGRIQYEDDRFSGYNYQASEVFGYGRKLVNRDSLKINTEGGVGVRQNDFENGQRTSENILVFSGDIDWKINPFVNLTEVLTIEAGEERTISKSVTSLKNKINSSLSSKITYTVKHSSEVPVGTEKTDTELAVTLVYAFK